MRRTSRLLASAAIGGLLLGVGTVSGAQTRADAVLLLPWVITELEREVVSEFRWWSADEMDATDEVVYPDGLSALVRRVASGDIPVPAIELIWSTP